MPRPPLDDQHLAQAVEAYYTAREGIVRSVLIALDRTATDAMSRPYPEVLARVRELIDTEIGRYADATTPAEEAEPKE